MAKNVWLKSEGLKWRNLARKNGLCSQKCHRSLAIWLYCHTQPEIAKDCHWLPLTATDCQRCHWLPEMPLIARDATDCHWLQLTLFWLLVTLFWLLLTSSDYWLLLMSTDSLLTSTESLLDCFGSAMCLNNREQLGTFKCYMLYWMDGLGHRPLVQLEHRSRERC